LGEISLELRWQTKSSFADRVSSFQRRFFASSAEGELAHDGQNLPLSQKGNCTEARAQPGAEFADT
jgi:hypothetical protein